MTATYTGELVFFKGIRKTSDLLAGSTDKNNEKRSLKKQMQQLHLRSGTLQYIQFLLLGFDTL